nr:MULTISPECIES: isoprenyl transferase [Brachybacterium]
MVVDDDGILYRVYEKRLIKELDAYQLPQHLGVIVDGNRRWAKASGITTAEGHRQGGAKITEFLTWCEELEIPLVTVWMLSTDNLRRGADELALLFEIIAETVESIAGAGYTVRLAGSVESLPEATRERVAAVQERSTPSKSLTVNVAIGYGGREEIVDAVRELVRDLGAEGRSPDEIAEAISMEGIGEHLYTRGQPDPDLIIRSSGEQRLSGFLMWQSAHSEFWFCETNWPGFRRVDLLRALRDYCQRERRFGA